ncbi:GNAT family N-acetyltransferase [Methylobacterium sp. E-065]|uniref:GNAT family N-acetyltransferase n=1 Tax=Methylobacterium sp. E-065 TaxID=2836583 RepID=UPI001FBA77E6|nr:GNAT family N-acetyltransferase [Methylobacterium sp. E-065]MCJ2018552.1 GNAT family N-acetyltransferase [Methylobacterium sp. E-065]
MAPRFTVIQGGQSGAPGCAAAFAAGPELDRTAAWRVDLRRPGGVDAASVAAWRAMLVRNAVTDPLRDPDHLLPLAQHRAAGSRVAIALVWDRDAETGREALQGVMPLAMPHPIWGGRARPWQPAEAQITALVGQAAAEAVDRALRDRLGALRRPIRLAGALEPARETPRFRPVLASARSARSRSIPTPSLIGIRPAGWEAPTSEIRTVTEPQAVRDAVETFLALDARTARHPIIADPAEASLVRVVSRLFGRRGALRVEFLRRAGEIVAGTLHLGAGPASIPWRRARA